MSTQFECQKQFYSQQFGLAWVHSLVLFDPYIGPYQVLPFRARVNLGVKARGTPHSPKLQHYWNLIFRLFSVLCRTFVGGVLPLFRDVVGVFYCPSRLGQWNWDFVGRKRPQSSRQKGSWVGRSITIKLFCVINRTLVGGVLLLCRDEFIVFYSPS